MTKRNEGLKSPVSNSLNSLQAAPHSLGKISYYLPVLKTLKVDKILGMAIALFIINSSFLIPDCQCQWVIDSNGIGNRPITSLAFSGNNIFAGCHNAWGVYLSTNNGANWAPSGLLGNDIPSLAVNGIYIFAGTVFNGIYLSTNNGANWTQTSLNNQNVHSIAVSGNYVFAGTFNGVFVSTNNGGSWNQTSLNNRRAWALAISGNNIFAGTQNNGIYVSSNNGSTWSQTTLITQDVHSLAVNGNYIFAGCGVLTGVYLSTNNGTSWTQTSLNNKEVWSLAVNGNNVFAGIINSPLFYSSNDNGTSWIVRNEGLASNAFLKALLIFNNYLLAGTDGSVYRRQISELIGIKTISNKVPSSFSLSQNYPNPFNPVTKIRFELPENSFVKLVIYDVIGREIEIIVNERLKAGTYEADLDGSNLSSGVYFYSLSSGEFSQTRKAVLTK